MSRSAPFIATNPTESMTTYNLKCLPSQERPRERLLEQGSGALSTSELIAIILGSGMKGKSVLVLAQEILSRFSLSQLQELSVQDLCQIKGLGEAKAIQLKAAIALASRIQQESEAPKSQVTTPEHAYRYLRGLLIHEKREIFGVLLQDVRGQVLKWEVVSIGTLTQVLTHPREVFGPAIRYHAASLVLVHNHPSGDPSPSPQDYRLTRSLIESGHRLGIPVRDHLIIAAQGYVSLKELGVNF